MSYCFRMKGLKKNSYSGNFLRYERDRVVANRFGAIFGIYAVSVMIGWIFNLDSLKSFSQNQETMKFNTSLSFILLWLVIILKSLKQSQWTKVVQHTFLAIIFLISLLVMVDYLSPLEANLNEYIIAKENDPGRMAPQAALNFLLSCLVILFADRWKRLSESLTLITLFISFVYLIGYLFGSKPLYGVPGLTPIALNTVISFIFVALANLFLIHESQTLKIFRGRGAGSKMLRQTLPALSLLLIVVSYLVEMAHRYEYIPAPLDISFIVLGGITLISFVLWKSAKNLNVLKNVEEENRKLANIIRTTPDAVISFDLSGKIKNWNKSAFDFFDFKIQKDVPLKDILNLGLNSSQVLENTIKSGSIVSNLEIQLERNEHKPIPVSITIIPTRDSKDVLDGSAMIFRDLTAQKKVEEEGARFAAIVKSSNEAIISTDLEGKIVTWNPSAEQILGYRKEEVIGQSIHIIFPEDIGENEKRFFEKATDKTSEGKFEVIRKTKDGTKLNFLLSISHIKDSSGKIIGVSRVLQDITEKIKSQQALLEFNAELEERIKERTKEIELQSLIVQNMAEGVCLIKASDGTIVYANQKFENLFGYAPNSLVNKHVSILNAGPSVEVAESLMEEIASKGALTYEVENVRKDGSHFWCRATTSVFNHPTFGKVYVAVQGDITERKEALNQLIAKEYQLNYFIQHSPASVAILDKELKYLFASEKWIKQLQLSEDIIGKSFHEVKVRYPISWENSYRKSLEGKIEICEAEIWRNPEGKDLWIKWEVQPWKDVNGQINGIFIAFEDITARQNAAELLRTTANELARSNDDLEKFAYVCSHDLKEPLRMISNYVDLLEESLNIEKDSDANKYMNYVKSGATRMQALISDLLAYSKVGQGILDKKRIDLSEMVKRILFNLKEKIQAEEASISYDDLPRIWANEFQFELVLQNLIMNALKFRGKDRPVINISALEKNNHLEITVSDNGIGIEPQYFSRIFIIFQRLHTQAEYPGTGIGLAICKKIVERHGGKIWVESEPGKGSRFIIQIPANKPLLISEDRS